MIIIVSKSLNSMVVDFKIMEDGTFYSDHWPTFMSMEGRVEIRNECDHCDPAVRRLLWRKATAEDLSRYQKQLGLELGSIEIPVEAAICNDPESCSHKHTMETYLDSICSAVLKSAKCCIPI